MVDFGRVEGIVELVKDGGATRLRLTVTLETPDAVRIVRRETLDPVRPVDTYQSLSWHADQWTQETIGIELAEQGWEVLGVDRGHEADEPGPPRSNIYSVRRIFRPLAEQ